VATGARAEQVQRASLIRFSASPRWP
jgi:hypothetical protein